MIPSLLTEGVRFEPGSDAISLIVPGRPTAALSMRSAILLRDSLLSAISAKLLPTGAFRWVEPTQNYKEAAALVCEDSRYLDRFQMGVALPPLFGAMEKVEPHGRIAGYVIQQEAEGQSIPRGHYLAIVGQSVVSSSLDFEEAQASVSTAVKGLLGIA